MNPETWHHLHVLLRPREAWILDEIQRLRTRLGLRGSYDVTFIDHMWVIPDGFVRANTGPHKNADGKVYERMHITAPLMLPFYDNDRVIAVLLHELLHAIFRQCEAMKPAADQRPLPDAETRRGRAFDDSTLADAAHWLPDDLRRVLEANDPRVTSPEDHAVFRFWRSHELPEVPYPSWAENPPCVEGPMHCDWAIVDKALALGLVETLSDEMTRQLEARFRKQVLAAGAGVTA